MKKCLFFSVMLAFSISGLAQQQTKSPYEGAWKFVGLTLVSGDNVRNWTTAQVGEQVKMWTGNHFSFTGTTKNGMTNTDVFGYGTYTLNDKDYVESIVYHNDKSVVNTKFRAKLEFRNDTLYQTYPDTDASGKATGGTVTEKYVKIK